MKNNSPLSLEDINKNIYELEERKRVLQSLCQREEILLIYSCESLDWLIKDLKIKKFKILLKNYWRKQND